MFWVLLVSLLMPELNEVLGNAETAHNMSTAHLVKLLSTKINWRSLVQNIKDNQSPVGMKMDRCLLGFVEMNEAEVGKTLDSSWKVGTGVLDGNIYWLGDYRECMQTDNLHYCAMADIMLFGQMPLTAGICVPETCKEKDLDKILSVMFSMANIPLGVHLIKETPNERYIDTYGADRKCYSKQQSLSYGAWVMLFISLFILLLSIFGSLTDIMNIHTVRSTLQLDNEANEMSKGRALHIQAAARSNLETFFLCFSLIKNTRNILKTESPEGAITSLSGIRFLSITWVILGHCLVFALSDVDNLLSFQSRFQELSMQVISNATVSVDTFFLLSGILVAYCGIKKYEQKKKFPLLSFYLHRYLRLTPSYLYVIFFIAYLYPYLGDGPQWFMQGPDSKQSTNCIRYWWTNILYINNFYPTSLSNECMNWSWYLSNDMQFYVISPIILFAMYKWKWRGALIVNGLLIIGCCIVNGVVLQHYNASPLLTEGGDITLIQPNSPSIRYMNHIYEKPYARIAPYLIGILLGYMLFKKCKYNKRFSTIFHCVGWLLAIITALLVVYGPYTSTKYRWGEDEHLVYGIFFRIAWTISVGWVIYACQNNYGGIVNDILSWRVFLPLSRLTYSVYLVHPLVISLFVFTSNTTLHLTTINIIFMFLNAVFVSHMVGYLLAVFIEFPLANLEKMLL